MMNFLRDDRGSSTVEFCLWIPAFMAVMLMTVDICLFFVSYTQMIQATRDTARRVSVGEIDNLEEAEVITAGRLAGRTFAFANVTSNVVTVTAQRPVADIVISAIFVGLWGNVNDANGDLDVNNANFLTTQSSMRLEPGVQTCRPPNC